LGAITSAGLTNILIVVVRYFGGILLGASGLINAYRTASSEAIRNAEITVHNIQVIFRLRFGYALLNEVMQLIKSNDLQPTSINMEESCEIVIAPMRSDAGKVKNRFGEVYGVDISEVE